MLDFGRTAIVARMSHAQAHDGTAHECFAHGHTLGLVMAAARQIEADFAHRDEVLNSRLLVAAITDFSRYSSDCLLLVDHQIGRAHV